IAIGQLATGVIAIGQLARGVFAIGMLSTGLVSVGMLSLGLVHCVAMLGAGSRGRGMLLIPLCPKLPFASRAPELSPPEDRESGRASGWIGGIVASTPGGLGIVVDGQPLRARLGASMLGAATQAMASAQRVLAYVVPAGQGAEITRLMRAPTT